MLLLSPFHVYRQNGLGYTSFMARLGASISPLIMLLEDKWTLLPEVIFCTLAIFSGLIAWLLPETSNARLPETIEDIEEMRYKKKKWQQIQDKMFSALVCCIVFCLFFWFLNLQSFALLLQKITYFTTEDQSNIPLKLPISTDTTQW